MIQQQLKQRFASSHHRAHARRRPRLIAALVVIVASACAASSALASTTISATAGTPFTGTVGTATEPCPIDDMPPPGHPHAPNCALFGDPSTTVTGTITWGDGTAAGSAAVTRTCPPTYGASPCTITIRGTHTYAAGGTYNGSYTWSDSDPYYGLSGSGTFTALVSGGSRGCAGTTPVAVTGAAQNVASTTATVAGTVNPCGTSTGARFAYGPTPSYGLTTATQPLGSATTPQPVSAALTGLTPGTTYHYRVEALPANNAPTPPGLDGTFTTTGVSPFTVAAPSPPPSGTALTRFSGTVARITDGGAGVSASSFTATIGWGTGGPANTGTITADGPGQWIVTGSHQYPLSANDAAYPVTVKVTKAGQTQTMSFQFFVQGTPAPRPPVAGFTTLGDPYSLQERFPVTFDASASYSDCEASLCSPPSYAIARYVWTVDGTQITCDGPQLTAIFPQSETAHVSLQVFDDAYPNQASTPVAHDVLIRDSLQGSPQPRPLFVQCGDASNLRVVDVRATGIEVNQDIQSESPDHPTDWTLSGQPAVAHYAGVPLSAGHLTAVRVFGDAAGAGGPLGGVQALLHGFDAAGHELPDSPLLAVNGPHGLPDTGSAALTWDTVKSRGDSFNFVLPTGWTRGTISLRAELVPPASALEVSCSGCSDFELRDVHFTQLPDLHITPLRLDYAGNPKYHDPAWWGRSGTLPADPPNVDQVFDTAQTIMPMHLVIPPYQGIVDITDILRSQPVKAEGNNWQRKSQLAKDDQLISLLHLLDMFGAAPSSSPLVGITSGYTDYTGATDVGIGGITDGYPLAVVDVNRPLDSVTHELGHDVGRQHASPCGGAADPNNGRSAESWPPDQVGALQGVGLDPRTVGPDSSKLGFYPDEPGKSHYEDYMSYCKDQGQWVSVPGWKELFNAGRARDLAAADHAAAAAAAHPALRVEAAVTASGTTIDAVNVTAGGGPSGALSTVYRLVAKTRSGAVVANVPMSFTSGHGDGAGPTVLLSGALPARSSIASVSVTDGKTVLATRLRSRHAPTVALLGGRRVVSVRRGATTIRWAQRDADHDPLWSQVDYSATGRGSWRTIYLGLDRTRTVLANRLLSASRHARLRITVSDGFNQTTVVSRPFTAPGAPPVVTISAPPQNSSVAGDAALVLTGTAFDDRAAQLRGRSLRWYAGRQLLGTGAQLTVSGLRPGRQTITLRAVDHLRRSGSAAVRVRVLKAKPAFLLLALPKSLSAKATRVGLRVRSSLPATLAIGRRRFSVSRRTRQITVPVARSRHPLVLTLTLSAWGSRTADTVVIPRR